jgi:hypothetical protein
VRGLRGLVADREVEGRQLLKVGEAEAEARERLAGYQVRAMEGLEGAMRRQMREMEGKSGRMIGKVTPYGMEVKLDERYREGLKVFERLSEESGQDVLGAEKELEELKKEVQRERMIQDQLNHEKLVNAKELEGLEDLHSKLKEDLVTVNV